MKTSWIVVIAVAVAAGVAAFVLLGRSANKETNSVAQVVTGTPAQAGVGVAEANLQTASASMQGYYVANGTYAGATVSDPTVRVVSADASGYCIESTVAGQTASEHGPGGTPAPGAC
jgi:ABC-type Na+ efflux pump permease subunit